MKPSSLLITLLLSLSCVVSLPATASHEMVRRRVAFIVRKPDKAKTIAARFHVSPKEFKAFNPGVRRNKMLYAGKQLHVPVWLERKNEIREGSDFNMNDYTLAKDSLDEYIDEDFVNVAGIEADTVRRGTIDRQISGLDRRLQRLYYSLDSATRSENADYAELSLRDQKKLMIARLRNNPHASINTAIDELNKQKAVLQGEKNTINARVSDYENLVENASYAAAHPEEAQTSTFHLNEWADESGKTADDRAGLKSKK